MINLKNKTDNSVPAKMEWTPELIRRYWHGYSQSRLTELSFGLLAAQCLVLAIWRHLPRNARILDYGSGDGQIVLELLKHGFNVAAYEPSANRQKSLLERVGNKSNFLELIDEKSDDVFDVVVMSEVIEHLTSSELNQALNLINKFLSPGGILVVTTPNNEDLDLGMSYCPGCNHLFHRWQHVRSFDVDSLIRTLSVIDVTPIVVHQIMFEEKYYLPYADYLYGRKLVTENDIYKNNLINRLKNAYAMLMDKPIEQLPRYLYDIQQDQTAYIGNNSHLLFIGKKY